MDLSNIIQIITTIGGLVSGLFGIFFWNEQKRRNELIIEQRLDSLK
jgi:hypothetical protein